MHAQVAKVSRSLQSVRQLHRTGHLVVFDGSDSFCLNKQTGEVNMIIDDGTNYTMGVWVIPRDELSAVDSQGFTWQAN